MASLSRVIPPWRLFFSSKKSLFPSRGLRVQYYPDLAWKYRVFRCPSQPPRCQGPQTRKLPAKAGCFIPTLKETLEYIQSIHHVVMNHGGFPDCLLCGRHSAGHCGDVAEKNQLLDSALSLVGRQLRGRPSSQQLESDPGQGANGRK